MGGDISYQINCQNVVDPRAGGGGGGGPGGGAGGAFFSIQVPRVGELDGKDAAPNSSAGGGGGGCFINSTGTGGFQGFGGRGGNGYIDGPIFTF